MTEAKKKSDIQIVHVGKDKMPLAVTGMATAEQVKALASMTPECYIQKREGRGGKLFDYVNINYVIAMLNAIFGFNWSVEIIDKEIGKTQVYVHLRLKVRFGDGTEVSKDAFGGSDVKRKKGGGDVIDIADDLKSAQSDATKKAASMLGIAWDVYSGVTKAKNGNGKKKDKGPAPDPAAESNEGISDEAGFESYPEVDTADGFRDITLIMTDGTERKVTKFEALEYFGKIKKAIGDVEYYKILEDAGYKKSNMIPDVSMPKMYALMIKAYQEIDDALPF